jgi:plastocyanin
MRLRKRHVPLVALLCAATVGMLPSLASSATTASVEALNEGSGLYGETHRWSPSQVAVTTSGGKVTFANHSMAVPHGIVWQSTPATPACEEGEGKVPVGKTHSATNWSGACTFTQEGTYTYYCSVHGLAMSGTVYVNAAGALPPTAVTEAATGVTEIAATLKGAVNPNGQATSYYFNYGATASYGQKTTELSVGADSVSHALSAPVSELKPGATYHFQVVATYASGASRVLGGDRTLTTLSPPGAPTASTGEATGLSETGATLAGAVNPNGKATTWFFNYGTTDSYGQSTPVQSAGEGSFSNAVSAPVSGLAPGTLYHFQLVAHNELGDAPGGDRTFTTSSPAPAPPETTTTTTTTPAITPSPIVSGGATPPPSLPAPLPILPILTGGSPLAGSAATAVKVASAQRGSSVHGSVAVAPAGAGGRLEVDLLAATASLARKHSKQQRIGRFVRSSLAAGKVSFSVSLDAQAKRALSRRHHLPVVVQVSLTPLHGAPVMSVRSVVLRG